MENVTFTSAKAKTEAIVNAINALGGNYKAEIRTDEFGNPYFGYTTGRHVWHWMEIMPGTDGLIFFKESYSCNTGSCKKGWNHGFKVRQALEKKIGSALFNAVTEKASAEVAAEIVTAPEGIEAPVTSAEFFAGYSDKALNDSLDRRNANLAKEGESETYKAIQRRVIATIKAEQQRREALNNPAPAAEPAGLTIGHDEEGNPVTIDKPSTATQRLITRGKAKISEVRTKNFFRIGVAKSEAAGDNPTLRFHERTNLSEMLIREIKIYLFFLTTPGSTTDEMEQALKEIGKTSIVLEGFDSIDPTDVPVRFKCPAYHC